MGSKKALSKFFRQEASKLPPEEYTAYHKFSQIQMINVASEGQDKNMQPLIGVSQKHPVNHARRLRRLYKKHGKEAVDKYFSERGFKLVSKDEYYPTEQFEEINKQIIE